MSQSKMILGNSLALMLQTASKYPVYGMEQLSRNSNECLQTGFVLEPRGLRRRPVKVFLL